ncbi:UNVERIFIED_CONTAM: Organic cation/carnitine transporter 3 [Sesamum angustifolium]|uniref:Organic cation/carnitine transporter 3 n=1 Tax=Sesamum angustifolium TaxID=2727405 RepID=A0AAW2PFG1_9LAMI
MADPNPLLSQTSSGEPEAAPPLRQGKLDRRPSLDDTIEHCIGEFGWTQILQVTLVSFAWFFDAQQTFISIFTDAEPKWSCINSKFSSSCNENSNPCQLPSESWSWDFPASTSIISEWSLECAGSIITGLPASAFFSGCLVGGFALASLADSALGRKNMLVLSSLLMSLTGVITAASTNVWMYAGVRFIGGFFMEANLSLDLCSFSALLNRSVFPGALSGKRKSKNRHFLRPEDLGGERLVVPAARGCYGASLLTFLLIGKLDRKGSVLGLSLFSGVCSVCCVLVRWKVLQIILELMSFFSACTAFDIVLIFTLELFPTCVRNSAVAMVRQALVLGGALSPVLVAAGRKNGLLMSYGVFGVTISICGLFVVFLPETRGRFLSDTMEEEEHKNAAYGIYCV